jgi:hypothetical protein
MFVALLLQNQFILQPFINYFNNGIFNDYQMFITNDALLPNYLSLFPYLVNIFVVTFFIITNKYIKLNWFLFICILRLKTVSLYVVSEYSKQTTL